jgi:integrase
VGRTGSGVEVREKSIRLSFVDESGEPQRHTLTDDDGKPLAPTGANVKRAHRIAAEIREKVRHGIFVLAEYFPVKGGAVGPLTVGAQLDAWYGTLRMEHSTLAGYSSAVKFWKAARFDRDQPEEQMGTRALRQLTLTNIKTAIAFRPDLTGKTINNYVSVLREALDLAVAERVIPLNPVTLVPRAKHQKDPPDPFSREEAEAIIADALKHYPEPIANHIEWRFFTGVRTSEAAGLRWPNVDLFNDSMLITEAIVRGSEKDRTKTNVARNVALNSRALAAIKRQAKHTRMAGEHVWLDPRYGTPWLEERAFRRSYWTPALKRLGIRYRAPNNMRHTYATMMLMAGRTPGWCAKQLGHSVEMFLRTYSKWLEGEQDSREMRGLEDWISAGDSSPILPRKDGAR